MTAGLAQHLKHFTARKLTGDTTAPFHMLVNESWDGEWRKEYRMARAFDRAVRKTELQRVWILSYSCSGTHSFYTHFHYMPAVFAFGENTFIDKENDPFQFRFQSGRLRPAHWLYGSAFGEHGLQSKDGRDLTHLFLLSNHYLKYRQAATLDSLLAKDRLIFYQRNFLRVLFSQDRDSRKFKKPHFEMTPDRFSASVASHQFRMAEMVGLCRSDSQRVRLCFHERFCAAAQRGIEEVCDFVDIAKDQRSGWDDPCGFFGRCYRSGEKPSVRNGALWCPSSEAPIRGKGGLYNPLPPVSLERTLSSPVREWITGDRLRIVREAFGDELVDFWLNDDTFDYANSTTDTLVGMLCRSVERMRL